MHTWVWILPSCDLLTGLGFPHLHCDDDGDVDDDIHSDVIPFEKRKYSHWKTHRVTEGNKCGPAHRFYFIFWPCHTGYGTLVPDQGLNPCPLLVITTGPWGKPQNTGSKFAMDLRLNPLLHQLCGWIFNVSQALFFLLLEIIIPTYFIELFTIKWSSVWN